MTSADTLPPEQKVPTPLKTQPLTQVPPSPPSGAPTPTAKVVRGSRLPDGWAPDDGDRAYARSLGATEAQIDRTAERFSNFWISKSGKDAVKADWPRTWRNWCLREQEDGKYGRAPPGADRSNVFTLDAAGNLVDDRQSPRQDRTYPADRPRRPGAHDGLLAAVDDAFGCGSQR